MTTEALALLPCFLDWHVLPRNVYSPSVAAYAGLYSVTILIHPGGIIPIEDCRVFVMRRRVTFHLTCPILFHQIYHSHNHTSQSSIQSYKSCRHSGIHTFMRIHIHAYTIKTISCVHGCINHHESCFNYLSISINHE